MKKTCGKNKSFLPSAFRPRRGGKNRGTILVPCLFMLTLMSLITLGILNVGGIGSSISSALAQKSQAELVAISGLEIGYRRLCEDLDYSGETCSPLSIPASSVEISVLPLANNEYEITALGRARDAERLLRTKVQGRQWVHNYPLSVGGDLGLWGSAKILGDCYVTDTIRGGSPAFISGDLHLPGDREIQYDVYGNPTRIDGFNVPGIEGDVHRYARALDFPGITLATLREQAISAGQLYSGAVFLENRVFDGVVYIENTYLTPVISNVVINGTLVCDDVWILSVAGGFLKVRCSEGVCPNVAVIAPETCFAVGVNAEVDLYGLSFFGSGHIFGKGTFTGPLVIWNALVTYAGSSLCCQFPTVLKDFIYSTLSWSEHSIKELEFEIQ